MNSLTHRMVALAVQKQLKQEMGIYLPKIYLIWGSIRPDLVKQPVSHFKDDKIDLFFKKWDILCQMCPEQQSNEFCVELGEIMHFLCDYFIYPHNEPSLMKEVWSHLKYENDLHKYACKVGDRIFQISYADYSMVPFRDLFEYKHKLFLCKLPSFENDLRCSFEMCMIAVRKLFTESVVILTKKVA